MAATQIRKDEGRYTTVLEYSGIEALFRNKCHATNRGHSSAGIFNDSADNVEWRGGFRGLGEYATFYRKGWPEGLAKIRENVERIEAPVAQSVRRRGAWMDNGDEVSMERVYLGNLDRAWRGTTPRSVTGPRTIHLWVDICNHCGTNPEAFFWPGAATVVLADALEEAGYNVEITAYAQVREPWGGEGVTLTTVGVKAPDEPLNLTRLAATIAHASTFRIGFFSAWLTQPYATGGLGSVEHRKPDFINPDAGEYQVQCWNADQANKVVRDTIREIERVSGTREES